MKKIWCNYFSPYLCTPNDEKGNDSVAQLVEQYTFNVWALGSSPSGITEMTKASNVNLKPFFFLSSYS